MLREFTFERRRPLPYWPQIVVPDDRHTTPSLSQPEPVTERLRIPTAARRCPGFLAGVDTLPVDITRDSSGSTVLEANV
jgi:hypothetical protein